VAVVSTLRLLAEKPSHFSLGEISSYATIAADLLEPRKKSLRSKTPEFEGQRSIEDENPGVIHLKGRPSVYD